MIKYLPLSFTSWKNNLFKAFEKRIKVDDLVN